ncbi:MAG: hypothetical protein M1827_005861 [Pycnora praestabilis]|nr:MAG: hypothetical protein M1827_005861 [Pycnora praestabilis]
MGWLWNRNVGKTEDKECRRPISWTNSLRSQASMSSLPSTGSISRLWHEKIFGSIQSDSSSWMSTPEHVEHSGIADRRIAFRSCKTVTFPNSPVPYLLETSRKPISVRIADSIRSRTLGFSHRSLRDNWNSRRPRIDINELEGIAPAISPTLPPDIQDQQEKSAHTSPRTIPRPARIEIDIPISPLLFPPNIGDENIDKIPLSPRMTGHEQSRRRRSLEDSWPSPTRVALQQPFSQPHLIADLPTPMPGTVFSLEDPFDTTELLLKRRERSFTPRSQDYFGDDNTDTVQTCDDQDYVSDVESDFSQTQDDALLPTKMIPAVYLGLRSDRGTLLGTKAERVPFQAKTSNCGFRIFITDPQLTTTLLDEPSSSDSSTVGSPTKSIETLVSNKMRLQTKTAQTTLKRIASSNNLVSLLDINQVGQKARLALLGSRRIPSENYEADAEGEANVDYVPGMGCKRDIEEAQKDRAFRYRDIQLMGSSECSACFQPALKLNSSQALDIGRSIEDFNDTSEAPKPKKEEKESRKTVDRWSESPSTGSKRPAKKEVNMARESLPAQIENQQKARYESPQTTTALTNQKNESDTDYQTLGETRTNRSYRPSFVFMSLETAKIHERIVSPPASVPSLEYDPACMEGDQYRKFLLQRSQSKHLLCGAAFVFHPTLLDAMSAGELSRLPEQQGRIQLNGNLMNPVPAICSDFPGEDNWSLSVGNSLKPQPSSKTNDKDRQFIAARFPLFRPMNDLLPEWNKGMEACFYDIDVFLSKSKDKDLASTAARFPVIQPLKESLTMTKWIDDLKTIVGSIEELPFTGHDFPVSESDDLDRPFVAARLPIFGLADDPLSKWIEDLDGIVHHIDKFPLNSENLLPGHENVNRTPTRAWILASRPSDESLRTRIEDLEASISSVDELLPNVVDFAHKYSDMDRPFIAARLPKPRRHNDDPFLKWMEEMDTYIRGIDTSPLVADQDPYKRNDMDRPCAETLPEFFCLVYPDPLTTWTAEVRNMTWNRCMDGIQQYRPKE